MKRIPFWLALAGLLLIAVPALADEARDYIDNEIKEWTQVIDNDHYTLLQTFTGKIDQEPVKYTFDLAPGIYHFYLSGGKDIEDLDAVIKNWLGRKIASDTNPDKIPVLVIELGDYQPVDLEIIQASSKSTYVDDYFCLLVATEDTGQIMKTYGGPEAVDEISINPTKEQGKQGGTSYEEQVHTMLEDWETLAEENDTAVISSDMYQSDPNIRSFSYTLEPAVYAVWAGCDPRCTDLNISVYDSANELLSYDRNPDASPYCEFLVTDRQDIRIEYQCMKMDSGQTWIAYMIKRQGYTDPQSRRSYVNEHLDSLKEYAKMDEAAVIDSGVARLSQSDNVKTIEITLDPNTYVCNAFAGLLIADLNMTVYDSNGNELFKDEEKDSHPVCAFDIATRQKVTIKIKAAAFRGNSPEDFFCWCLSSGHKYATQGN